MSDLDFYEALSKDQVRQQAGQEFFEKLSATSPAGDIFRRTLTRYKPELIGAAAGTALAGLVGYGTNKRWGGKPSQAEIDADEMHGAELASQERAGTPPSFGKKVRLLTTDANRGISKIMAEHPRSAALALGLASAGTGAKLGRLVSNMKRRAAVLGG